MSVVYYPAVKPPSLVSLSGSLAKGERCSQGWALIAPEWDGPVT